jgi:hypothetical protein
MLVRQVADQLRWPLKMPGFPGDQAERRCNTKTSDWRRGRDRPPRHFHPGARYDLGRTVTLVSERFGFISAALFLIDDSELACYCGSHRRAAWVRPQATACP